jgi:hypothetical protein
VRLRKLWFVLLVAACDASEVQLAVQGVGNAAHIGPVLAQAERDFIGDSGFGGNLGGSSGSGSGSGSGSDSGSSAPANTGGIPVGLTLALSRDWPVGGGMALRARAHGEYTSLHTSLPEGLGVLTDPMRVDIRSTALGGDLSLARRTSLPSGSALDYSAGLGVSMAEASVHLQSALIDRPSHIRLTQPYLLAQGRYLPRQGPEALAELRVLDRGQAELRLGLAQSF